MYNILSKSSVLALNCHLVIYYQYSYSLECMGARSAGMETMRPPPLKKIVWLRGLFWGLPSPHLTKFSDSAYVEVHS